MRDAIYSLIERTPLARPAIRLHTRWKGRRWRAADEVAAELDDGLPLPPPALRLEVANSAEAESYLWNGRLAAETLRRALARNKIALAGRVLDFGCGSGRVARHLRDERGIELHGCDPSARAIAWCETNLRFLRARRSAYDPPLPFTDASFDLVYGFSIFTHIAEGAQRPWLEELARVSRPGGHALLTAHGRLMAARLLGEDDRERFGRGELVVINEGASGMNRCGAFHPPGWLERAAGDLFEAIDYEEDGVLGAPGPDLYLLRRL